MTTRFVSGLRGFGPAVMLYLAAVALVGFAVDGGVYTVLLNLFLLRLDYGPEQIGMVNSSGMLVFALFSLPAGMLGERWGSRRMMLLGLGLLFVGCMLLPLADLLAPSIRLAWLIGSIIVLYLGLALYFVNTAPYVLGVIDAEQRNQIFSLQTGLLSLASFFGSLAGGFLPPLAAALIGAGLDQPAPYRYALLIAALALVPAAMALRAAPPDRRPPAAEPVEPTRGGGASAAAASVLGVLLLIALVRALQVTGLAATTTFFNVYLDSALRIPTAQIGIIIAVGRLLGVPAALATASLSRRFGNRRVVIMASLATALSMLPIVLVPHWAAAGLSYISVVSLSWIRYASSMVYFVELVPPSRRATVSGITEMAAGICFTLTTVGGGYIITLLGYRSLFLIGAALTALSAVLFWVVFRSRAATESTRGSLA